MGIQTSVDSKRNKKYTLEALILATLTFLLHFGSLNKALQKVVVSTIPTSLFVIVTFVMMLVSSDGGIATIVVGVAIIAAGPLVIRFIYRQDEEKEVVDDLEIILCKLKDEDSDESILSLSNDDDDDDDVSRGQMSDMMIAHSNETIDNEIVEDDEEVNISSTSSPVESIASPSTNALSTIAEYESDEGEQDDDLLSLKSGILEDDNFEDESEGGRRRSRRESGRKVKRNRSGMRRNSLMKKRIANAHEHLRDSEEMAKKQMKDRMAKRLNQRKTKDGSNEQDNHGRVVHVPSNTALDEDANIANSILYDGNGDGDTTGAD